MWWHTIAINICKQKKEGNFFTVDRWSNMLCKKEKVKTMFNALHSGSPLYILGNRVSDHLLSRRPAFCCLMWEKKNRIEEIIIWVEMLCSVSEPSWPFPSFCLPLLVMALSSLAVARGHAVSSIAVVMLPILAQSALCVSWGEELHSLIMGKAISPSAAVHTAHYSFQG